MQQWERVSPVFQSTDCIQPINRCHCNFELLNLKLCHITMQQWVEASAAWEVQLRTFKMDGHKTISQATKFPALIMRTCLALIHPGLHQPMHLLS